MPTAADHRGAAMSLEYSAHALVAARVGLIRDRHDLGLRGGTVTPLVERAIDASVATVGHVHRCCTALVDELRRRAVLCDQYTVDLRSYRVAHDSWSDAVRRYHEARDDGRRIRWPGTEPTRPAPPFPGAEAG